LTLLHLVFETAQYKNCFVTGLFLPNMRPSTAHKT